MCNFIIPLLVLSVLFVPKAGFAARQERATPLTVHIPGGVTNLDEIGLYEVAYHYFDGRNGRMPVGWTGHFEDTTGISCTLFGSQDGKSAYLIHPPWHTGTGATDQDFHLLLPSARRLSLQFSVAMQTGSTGPARSDGATFRVFLDGKPLLDENKTDERWSPHRYDLTPSVGKEVNLRFEVDPGPQKNSSFDFALWGDRQIVADGAPVTPAPVYHRALAKPGRMTGGWGFCSPTFGPPWNRFHLATSILHPTGLLDGWSELALDSAPTPGTATGSSQLPIGLAQGYYLDLVAPDGKIVRSDSPSVQTTVEQPRRTSKALQRIVHYHLGDQTITVQADIWPAWGSTAQVVIRSDDPYIAAVHFGGIGPVAFRRQVIVPYYGTIDYLMEQGLFASTTLDFLRSNASELQGTTAFYRPLTDGKRNPVRETAYYALSPDIHEVLPTPPNPPSPYRQLLGGRAVLDVWGGSFTGHADWLRELASYHLTRLATIVHDWQHGGYDNQLPNVLPAQEKLGGDAGMKEWVRTALGLGEIIGVHENYVDFYPNAAAYDETDVARDSEGHLVPAWKNLIQSYAVAPTAILKYAHLIAPEVEARFGTNGAFLDVHSSVPPWFHVDFRADQPGAGKFSTVWTAHRDLWKFFRQVHNGPVFGEGSAHWRWSGLLDGVEAQFGLGVPSNGGETAPLFPDFDLLKIHPLQFNHGMGYLERWRSDGPHASWPESIPPMKYLDQYRLQEITYGHAAFIASPLVRNLPFIWQEHNLVLPVTEQYATAQPTAIEYEVDGKMMDASEAIAARTAFDRVHIRYDNGLSIWANGRNDEWNLHTAEISGVLPQYGWIARGNGMEAYTALRDGVVIDYAETPTTLFANARTTIPEPARPVPVEPSIANFTQTGPRQFEVTFQWNVGAPIPAGESAFIHVTGAGTDQGESILFQPPMGIATAPSTWPAGGMITGQPVPITLPDTIKDGTLEFKAGLYQPTGGERMHLQGKDDGGHRIILGTLTVADSGKSLRFEKPNPVSDADRALRIEREAHTNPGRKRINFGKVETDGSVLLEKEKAGSWLLTPFPRTQPFTVILHPTLLDHGLEAVRIEALGLDGKSLGPVVTKPRLNPGMVEFTVNVIPGTVRYRIVGNSPPH